MHIFHITDEKTWAESKKKSEYRGDSLAAEGFIHCCSFEQVAGVLKKWFEGKADLILLGIDVQLLRSPIIYENLEGGEELFPHIYGPINNDAVINAKKI
jgi:uncharacterized protein (DUF952 family)